MPSGMAKPRFLVVALALLLTLAAACASDGAEENARGEVSQAVVGKRVETEGGSYVNVTPRELRSMLESKDFPLVNVHTPYEGEIEGTDLFIPFDEIAERLGQLPAQRESKIVVYCRSGSMSAIAATTLVSLGYANVWNLDGGMIAWEKAGYPLLTAEQ